MATTVANSSTNNNNLGNSSINSTQTSNPKLNHQAATAALYASHPERNVNVAGNRFLDTNNKLSSAGAAASLKYADPRDLPSYPSSGLSRSDISAATTAASLGWANQKPFEHWKPETSASAARAAIGAFDYKAPPLWQPDQSTNGAKAALLAARDGAKVTIWKPEPSAWGNSAASQAFRSERSGALSPQIDSGHTTLGRQGSLLAATGAMSGNRKRAESTPIIRTPAYPDEANAVANALSAATHANKPNRKFRTDVSAESGASPFTNMPKEMFTSHPPVAPEVDERKRADVLRASAVAMAQQMYKLQQKQIDDASRVHKQDGLHAANSAHSRKRSTSSSSDKVVPMKFNNLQEAAQKLAQERLAKLHDEHAQNREYRDYYGGSTAPSSRLSIRGRPRRRASSDGTLSDDKQQSQKIRAQMSLFSTNLSHVDTKKRQMDREALMAAAQRNVTKSLHGMDEKVFADTGKISPSMMNDWEIKAHAAAQKNSDTRMENHGRVNIGGGKFMNQSAVDLVARRNVQPVLDEINEKAEQQRARDIELKLEQEAQKRAAETMKSRDNEVKEVNRKLKEQDKREERMRKDQEKAVKAELKRIAKEEKRKSKDVAITQKPVASELQVTSEESDLTPEARERPVSDEATHVSSTIPAGYSAPPSGIRTSMEMQQQERLEDISHPKDGLETSPSSSPEKSVKGWFRNRFSRRMSRGQKSDTKESSSTDKTFIGGATNTGAGTTGLEHHSPSVSDVPASGENASSEIHIEASAEHSERRASTVSAVSKASDDNDLVQESSRDDEFEEARDHFNEDLAPPPTFAIQKSSSPVRDSKFHEVI